MTGSAKQFIATALVATTCGFAGSALGLFVLHDQFRGQSGPSGPTGPQGATGPTGSQGSQGRPGPGLDLLDGAYVIGSPITWAGEQCPSGTTRSLLDGYAVTVGAEAIGTLTESDLETYPLCQINSH